jgi:glycosyltransferase involved in cell wall biosynthesis
MNHQELKVLWFTNTPAGGAKRIKLTSHGGGWLKALDLSIQRHVQLHVVFNFPKPLARFKHGNTSYYPVTIKRWRLQFLRNNLTSQVFDREFEDIYLDLINEIKPDIIHIHGTENPYGCIIGRTIVPVVVSIQGNATVYTHKYFSGLERRFVKIRRSDIAHNFKSVLLSKSFFREYNILKRLSYIEMRNLHKCRYVIGRTDWDKRISSILAPLSRYFSGEEILRDAFYNKEWQHTDPSDTLVLHTTTSNGFYKGFETLCLALYELIKLHVKVEWRIAGLTESDLIVQVTKKFLGQKFPHEGLLYLGNLNEEMLAGKLLEADIYVMPSHIENSSNSLCEAMILGLPCIAAYSGGTGSLVTNGEDGILIQDGDPWVLAGAILELSQNWRLAVEIGRKARIRALDRHDKDKITLNYINIYKEIIDDSLLLNKV